MYIDSAEVVAAAMASGRIGPASRGRWLNRIRAGGRAGADSIMDLLSLAPVGPRHQVRASGQGGGQDDADTEAERIYSSLYPETQAPSYGHEPDRGRQADLRLGWLQHNASTEPATPGADHEIIDHPQITVQSHDHVHSSYSGGTHRHAHAHTGDHSHAPGPPNHLHQLAGDPTSAGIAAKVRGTAAASLTDAEIYAKLYGDDG